MSVKWNLLLPNDSRIRVDDIEILVHPQLMRVITHQHSPMLRRIGIFVDLVCDQLTQTRLLCEPFACCSTHRMPANLDGARRPASQRL
jgi:hypothetical protein